MVELNELESYLYGLILTDGSIALFSRNRGRIRIELKYEDCELLETLHKYYPESKYNVREKSTNYMKNYKSCILSFYKKEFRDMFISCGIPTKNKSNIGGVPNVKYSEKDFWRGVVDGDGSLCITSKGVPMISLTIVSESLKESYLDMLNKNFGIVKNVNRNKRDNIYNICVYRKEAILLGEYLYDNQEVCLKRKSSKYIEFLNTKYAENLF